MTSPSKPGGDASAGLWDVLREWGRIGCLGFGGPPTHIGLLRELCVERRRWMRPGEFEDAIAACNLLPGPASTQLAIYCAWRVAGPAGRPGRWRSRSSCPGLVLILALAALFLAGSPPDWVRGAGAGAGAAVAAVAVHAGASLVPPSWRRRRRRAARWLLYLLLGAARGRDSWRRWLVLVLLGCGVGRAARRQRVLPRPGAGARPSPLLAAAAVGTGGCSRCAWVALKVGALSYGGGFVIIPLMQADAVDALPLDDRRRSSSTPSRSARSPPARSCRPSPSSATRPPASPAALLAVGRRLRAVVRLRPARRPPLRPAPRQRAPRARSSTAPDRRRSARSSAPRSRSPWR